MAARFDRSTALGRFGCLALVCLGTVHVVGANAAVNPTAPLAALDSRNPESTLAADVRAADSTLEAALMRDASDGQLDEHSLFAAAEIASGVSTPSQLAAAVAQFDTWSAELRQAVSNIEPAQQRAASVLAFLHRRVFPAGYDLQATELPRAFSAGRFNCVSATVLFNSLAREAGLDARAVRRPNHTCSLLVDGEKAWRVEATCPDWFDPNTRSQQFEVGTEACRAVRPGEGLNPISDVALVAMIYYNRGVEALRAKTFQQAISLNRRALSLDPGNSEAQGNLLAAFGRQAIELIAQRNLEGAWVTVEEGLAIDPNHAPLIELRQVIDRTRRASASNVSHGAP